MTGTDPAALTDQQHRAQLQVRARALRDYLRLWPIWKPGDDASFANLVTAAVPLIRTYNGLSATIAASYYQALRQAEEAPGDATPRLATVGSLDQITTSLYVTGQVTARNAVARGLSEQQAREAALTRTSGAVVRHVLAGGRNTILQSVQADRQALGWARVTDGNPCAFCLTLASRGAVYKSETTAGFQAHDACACSAQPMWEGTNLPASTQRWKDIYNAAQRAGIDDGTLQHGENPSAARINAVRRYLAANLDLVTVKEEATWL